MRQRYLLGRYNFEKYGSKFDFEDQDQSLLQNLYVQSTDVYRTITSGYSELTGFISSNSQPLNITAKQRVDMGQSGRGLPLFNVRRSIEIQDSLGHQAIVDGFVNQPIHTFIDHPVWDDNLAMESCKYVYEINGGLWKNDTTYTDVMYLRDDLKAQYQIEFSLNQSQVDDMTFHDAYQYADAVYSSRFEMVPTVANWTD